MRIRPRVSKLSMRSKPSTMVRKRDLKRGLKRRNRDMTKNSIKLSKTTKKRSLR